MTIIRLIALLLLVPCILAQSESQDEDSEDITDITTTLPSLPEKFTLAGLTPELCKVVEQQAGLPAWSNVFKKYVRDQGPAFVGILLAFAVTVPVELTAEVTVASIMWVTASSGLTELVTQSVADYYFYMYAGNMENDDKWDFIHALTKCNQMRVKTLAGEVYKLEDGIQDMEERLQRSLERFSRNSEQQLVFFTDFQNHLRASRQMHALEGLNDLTTYGKYALDQCFNQHKDYKNNPDHHARCQPEDITPISMFEPTYTHGIELKTIAATWIDELKYLRHEVDPMLSYALLDKKKGELSDYLRAYRNYTLRIEVINGQSETWTGLALRNCKDGSDIRLFSPNEVVYNNGECPPDALPDVQRDGNTWNYNFDLGTSVVVAGYYIEQSLGSSGGLSQTYVQADITLFGRRAINGTHILEEPLARHTYADTGEDKTTRYAVGTDSNYYHSGLVHCSEEKEILTSIDECNAAALHLKFPDTSAVPVAHDHAPKGCYVWGHGLLRFNSIGTTTNSDSSSFYGKSLCRSNAREYFPTGVLANYLLQSENDALSTLRNGRWFALENVYVGYPSNSPPDWNADNRDKTIRNAATACDANEECQMFYIYNQNDFCTVEFYSKTVPTGDGIASHTFSNIDEFGFIIGVKKTFKDRVCRTDNYGMEFWNLHGTWTQWKQANPACFLNSQKCDGLNGFMIRPETDPETDPDRSFWGVPDWVRLPAEHPWEIMHEKDFEFTPDSCMDFHEFLVWKPAPKEDGTIKYNLCMVLNDQSCSDALTDLKQNHGLCSWGLETFPPEHLRFATLRECKDKCRFMKYHGEKNWNCGGCTYMSGAKRLHNKEYDGHQDWMGAGYVMFNVSACDQSRLSQPEIDSIALGANRMTWFRGMPEEEAPSCTYKLFTNSRVFKSKLHEIKLPKDGENDYLYEEEECKTMCSIDIHCKVYQWNDFADERFQQTEDPHIPVGNCTLYSLPQEIDEKHYHQFVTSVPQEKNVGIKEECGMSKSHASLLSFIQGEQMWVPLKKEQDMRKDVTFIEDMEKVMEKIMVKYYESWVGDVSEGLLKSIASWTAESMKHIALLKKTKFFNANKELAVGEAGVLTKYYEVVSSILDMWNGFNFTIQPADTFGIKCPYEKYKNGQCHIECPVCEAMRSSGQKLTSTLHLFKGLLQSEIVRQRKQFGMSVNDCACPNGLTWDRKIISNTELQCVGQDTHIEVHKVPAWCGGQEVDLISDFVLIVVEVCKEDENVGQILYENTVLSIGLQYEQGLMGPVSVDVLFNGQIIFAQVPRGAGPVKHVEFESSPSGVCIDSYTVDNKRQRGATISPHDPFKRRLQAEKPTEPGCWVYFWNGCPDHADTWAADWDMHSWLLDDSQEYTAETCVASETALNEWCGTDGVEKYFVARVEVFTLKSSSTGGYCIPYAQFGGDLCLEYPGATACSGADSGHYLASDCDRACAETRCIQDDRCVGFTKGHDGRFKLKSEITGVEEHADYECYEIERPASPCADVTCPMAVCGDGSEPPKANDDDCCGDLSLCTAADATVQDPTETDSEDCKPRDDDTCLQQSEHWGGTYSCESSTQWCTSWAKDMQRCCPDSCGTGSLSEEECNALGGSGNCVYPNDAQPCGVQSSSSVEVPNYVYNPRNSGKTCGDLDAEVITSWEDCQLAVKELFPNWGGEGGPIVAENRASGCYGQMEYGVAGWFGFNSARFTDTGTDYGWGGQVCKLAPAYDWIRLNSGNCLDKDKEAFNYCSKHVGAAAPWFLDDCKAYLNTLDNSKISGLTWQTNSITGNGLCIVNFISNDACTDYQSELESDGWGCICWNLGGDGPAVAENGYQDAYNTCYVRTAADATTETDSASSWELFNVGFHCLPNDWCGQEECSNTGSQGVASWNAFAKHVSSDYGSACLERVSADGDCGDYAFFKAGYCFCTRATGSNDCVRTATWAGTYEVHTRGTGRRRLSRLLGLSEKMGSVDSDGRRRLL